MNRRELVLMVAAIPLGVVAAARHGICLVLGGAEIHPLPPLDPTSAWSIPGADGGFIVPKEMSEEIFRLMAIPPELIDTKGNCARNSEELAVLFEGENHER